MVFAWIESASPQDAWERRATSFLARSYATPMYERICSGIKSYVLKARDECCVGMT